MTDDRELIAQFAATRDARAFEELVRRHVDWIYAAARRQVGDTNAADVTQAVFVVLAEKAQAAARQPALSPWLFGVLRFTCLRCHRDQARRRKHERAAAAAAEQRQRRMDDSDPAERQQMLAMLDELIARLRERDRRPVVMRFYQRCSFAEIGLALGVSEEAARKRVTRSVDRLRSMFAARGVTGAPGDAMQMFAATTLLHAAPPAIAAHAVHAAVLHGAAAAAGVGASGVLAKGAIAMMRIQQLQRAAMVLLAVTTVAAVGGAATHVLGNSGPSRTVAATATATSNSPNLFAAQPRPPQIETIQSRDTLLAISKDRTRISGYSKQQGKWTPLKLDPDAQARLKGDNRLSPVVNEGVGGFRLGTKVYAYSPRTATWDQIEVADKPEADPVMMADQVTVNYDDHLHVFSAVTGKWTTVDFGQ